MNKSLYFPKRLPEPKIMEEAEFDIFNSQTKKNFKRWILPLVDDALGLFKKKPSTILDIACGPGLLTKQLAKQAPHTTVYGIDYSLHAIKLAKQNCFGIKNIKFKKANVYNLPFLDKSMDLVICKDSFHHFTRPKTALKEMFRVLKPGGYLYLQDLRRDIPYYIFKTSIPRDSIFQKLQYYSTRASYTKKEVKKLFSEIKSTHFGIKTRKLTKKIANHYKKIGIQEKELKIAFQARYSAIVHK